jgi:hypothetical protein
MSTKQSPTEFTQSLVKGRIAETIFERMLLATDKYTVLKGGYEHTMPLVVQNLHDLYDKSVLEGVRRSPDFVVIRKDNTNIHLVEVKYHKYKDLEYIIKDAEKIQEFWPHAELFVATNAGFFMDTCENIIKEGFIQPLAEDIVSSELQEDYLKILKEFLL